MSQFGKWARPLVHPTRSDEGSLLTAVLDDAFGRLADQIADEERSITHDDLAPPRPTIRPICVERIA